MCVPSLLFSVTFELHSHHSCSILFHIRPYSVFFSLPVCPTYRGLEHLSFSQSETLFLVYALIFLKVGHQDFLCVQEIDILYHERLGKSGSCALNYLPQSKRFSKPRWNASLKLVAFIWSLTTSRNTWWLCLLCWSISALVMASLAHISKIIASLFHLSLWYYVLILCRLHNSQGKTIHKDARMKLSSANLIVIGARPRLPESCPYHFTLAIFKYNTIVGKEYSGNS